MDDGGGSGTRASWRGRGLSFLLHGPCRLWCSGSSSPRLHLVELEQRAGRWLSRHSARTESSPRRPNRRNPRSCLLAPKTGSTLS